MQPEDLTRLKIDRAPQPASPVLSRKGARMWRLLGLVAAVAVAGLLAAQHLLHQAPSVRVGSVTTAYPSQAITLFNATGYVVPQTKADVASKATGRLEELTTEEGGVVKKGDIIARLENQDVTAAMERAAANVTVAKAKLSEAKAELQEASLALRRSRNLVAKKLIPQESHDAAVARHDKAAATVRSAEASITASQAAYNEAKVAVEYTLIRAPFDGVILKKHADIGDVLAPFSSTAESKGAVVSMADMSTLEVEADVSESNLAQISAGQPCEILLDALPEQRFRGAVGRIVPIIDRSKATVLAKVRFIDTDPRILPDMSAKVAFLSRALDPAQMQAVTVVEPDAIVKRGDNQAAFVVKDGQVTETAVALGARLGEWQTVEQGLSNGDQVVLSPPMDLADGDKVRIAAQ
jgi:RND family efflux transporter MFP subunit